jgi:3-phosphoshikimate 1-carboxyvinyltransferase
LEFKESNRGLTIQSEFRKMNVRVDLEGDQMLVHGGTKPLGNKVSSNHDHRIAMACSVLGLGAEGNTEIEAAESVSKSYPGFFTDLQMLGASVSLQES